MTPTETLDHLGGDGRFFGACVMDGREHVLLEETAGDGAERVTISIGKRERTVDARDFLCEYQGVRFRAATAEDVA